jgi:ribosomal protein L11 methyltransferase
LRQAVGLARDDAVNSVDGRKNVRRLSVLADASRSKATFVARLTTAAQVGQNISDHLADRLAASDIAVSTAETGTDTCELSVYFSNPLYKDRVREAVGAVAGGKAARTLRFSRLDAADWVGASLQGLAPVKAGRFLVHGAHDRGRVPANSVGVEIEAALAFGSGHHGTTRGCLLAFDRMCKSLRTPKRVHSHRTAPKILDIGTGSGVLAIAAARTLHRRVLATDIDPEAVKVARGNARLNRAAALVRLERANGLCAAGLSAASGFEVIFANILLAPLLRLASPLRQRVARGGRIVLSGLLRAQANAVIAAYRPLALENRIELDGWVTLVFARRSRPRFRSHLLDRAQKRDSRNARPR